jgi:hypothetical protein
MLELLAETLALRIVIQTCFWILEPAPGQPMALPMI